jgi:Tol biopolymer transport system component
MRYFWLAALCALLTASAWAGDAPTGRIVFVSDRGGTPDLYVANLDGTGLVRLTESAFRESHPRSSPDGQWIVFATEWERLDGQYASALPHIDVIRPDGTDRRTLVEADAHSPFFSADGRSVYYVSEHEFHDSRTLMRIGFPDPGKSEGLLFQSDWTGIAGGPSFHGDGLVITDDWIDEHHTNYRRSVMAYDRQGKNPVPLVKGGDDPCCSRDGAHLAYIGKDGHLYVARADGAGARKVADVRHPVYPASARPRFSPDGRWLLFASLLNADERHPRRGLFVVGVDGTGVQPVLAGDPSNWDADWAPGASPPTP